MYMFRWFVRELKRRREEENIDQRTFFEVVNVFSTLIVKMNSFGVFVQKRLRMIERYGGETLTHRS